MDNEIKGEGNSLNYTFRMHDSRIGRFFTTDPLEKKYPFYSPYQFSANSPIFTVELEGLESAEQINETEKVIAEHNHFILRAMASSPNFRPKHLWQLAFGLSGRYSAGLGAVGEGLVAQGLEGAAVAKHSSWAIPFVSFNVGNVKANPTGTWDVKLTLKARPTNRNVANGSNQGALVLNFDDYNGDTSFFGISLQDGPIKEIEFGSNQTINVLYETEALVEVKTLGQNKATLTNFKKGVDQAVKTAMLNKSNTSAVSVLAMDYDSYMKIYKENKTSVQKLYNTLTSNGAYLLLLKNLTKDARQNLNTLITKVKSEVDGSKPETQTK